MKHWKVRYNVKRLEFKYKVVLSKSNGSPTETLYFKSREDVITLLTEKLINVGFLYNRIALYGIMEEVKDK